MYDEEGENPRPLFDPINIGAALAVHLLLFGVLWLFGIVGASEETSDEQIIPIECLVVVHENLDGEEDEPPPEREVVPTPPEPQPDPAPQPEPDPVPDPVVEDPIVVEPDPPKPKPEPPKPKPEKKSDPPKKAEPPKETREERLKRMREGVKFEKPAQTPPRYNGRTEKKSDLADQLLKLGAKPSNRNQGLDASEESRCAGLIKSAFHEKWSPRPAWTPELRTMTLRVEFDMSGRVKSYRLINRSGDVAADNSVLNAAKRVIAVRGLTRAYLEKHPTSIINFEVEPL